MKQKILGIVISDIHFGIKNSRKLYQELVEVFISYILEIADQIDIIHINGDFFDKKINLNESASKLALAFFDEVVRICSENNIKLRVIRGTLSHDNDQLENFYHYYTNVDLDIKIIKTAEMIEEYEGVNYLYVPEEYVEDHREYYKDLKEQKPNIVMGHGTWDFVAFSNQISESESTDRTSPIFMYDEWKDDFDFAVFGHIHTRQKYKNKIWYPGSFSRWAHGEEKRKGFLRYEYDTDTRKYDVEFIENNKASEYKSLDITQLGTDINDLAIEDIVALANTALDSIDKVRLELTGLSIDKLILVKKALADNDKIKIKVKIPKDNSEEDKYEKYSYIVNRELPLPETLARYISEEHNVDIPLDILRVMLLPEVT